ncbi:MAG TPA: nuclear transport factor 2 family protein [Vicinamibacterales bacterium]|nr:nuclear transport factor 2 family protein [Vicinamibacterales bacterium]
METRTPEQVLASHRRALAARDWAAVRLNYADDAVVISDMGVTAGADAIVADLKAIVASLGPAVPTVRRQEIVPLDECTHMVRVLFSVATPALDVPDGVDTYFVRQGRIVGQTAHGAPQPKGRTRG